MSMQDLVTSLGLTIVCLYKGKGVDDGWSHFLWEVTVKRPDGRTFTGSYRAGLGHTRATWRGGRETTPRAPTLAEYLDCLQSDCRSGEHLLFSDFCDEFGYDDDSLSAEKIWRACQEVRGRMQHFLGSDFETFMSIEEV